MKLNQHRHRWLAMVLVFAMLMTLIPVDTLASTSGTIKGATETVKVNSGAWTERENDFNKEWKFYLGDNSSASSQNFDDSSWDAVDLPHDFSIIQAYTSGGEAESGFLPGGTGWYRKSFVLGTDLAEKNIMLNFDGVYSDAYVYVNGTKMGEHHYGYTSFAFDITDYLVMDGVTENVIAVKAVNNIPTSRWYSGSGIYRDVTLIITDDIHVDLNGTKITTPNISSGDGTVNVAVDVVNDGTAEKTVTVTNTICKKGDTVVLASASADVTVAAGNVETATANPIVSSPELWSIDSPNLYTVITELTVDGKVVDAYETNFGFRWFEFKNTGFYLNGEAVKLNGVCMHHDQGALGSAAYYDAMYRQLSKMKEMGCNAIRTAHNPADEQYIEICSELGLLVIEETFDGLVDAKNGNSNDFSAYFESECNSNLYGYTDDMTNAEYAARSHVKRDRNEPCIIAWSFGNEIQEGTSWANVSRYDDICANYITWVNSEDGSRPVTSGDNNRGGSTDLVNVINTITAAGGIAGFNYANSASTLYSLAQSYGGSKGVIIASETASATNSRGQYKNQNNNSDSDGAYHLTSYDTSSVSWGITAHDSIYNTYQYDCVAGEFVWTGFDYLGEPTPWNGTGSGDSGRGAIPNSSYFGIVETTGFEKDSYYLYRSQWNKEETTVHLVTAWDSDNYMVSGGTTPVWLYSNAPKVELYLNGNLIATSTRTAVTSTAGHTYYTYTSTSNSSVCTVSNGSGADALYGAYNVVYTAGTLSAKAYDANGNEVALDDSCGQYTVSTPGTVTQLNATVNKTEIAADGSSLAYIEVDVLDAEGNLDTTATNNITFTLTDDDEIVNGEIVAVDNGDQATTAKFQQASVLTSATSANINAYAGKALVIVRSTEDAGDITLNVASNGLTGKTVSIKTVEDTNSETASNGLVSYTMVKDYSVKVGTVPTLDTSSTGTLADGSTVSGTIVWNEVTADVYGTAGDYTLTGTLTFAGMDAIQATAKLHVIPNVIDLRNVSTATMTGVAPTLPNTVNGVLADGTLAGEFNVTWNDIPAASEYDTVGEIVTVTGTAVIFGDETMDVTCTVRVAEAVNTESTNVAPQYLTLEQDIASGYQSDVLTSITNGTLKPGDNTSERWTNWSNRTNSAEATLTLTWATAQMISSVNLYYYYDNCCAYPESLEFSYSLDGQNYTVIGHTAEQVETYSLGAKYTYTFDEPINPVGLKVKLTQQNGTSGSNCVGLTELEVMTYAASMEYNTSADLSAITVDGTAIEGFAADTLAYEVASENVAAETAVNAGITVLPKYESVVRVLTISEDGNAAKTYILTLTECTHTNTTVQGVAAATCTAEGYTGDTICTDCGETVTVGTVIAKKAHTTEVRNAVPATCTTEGYTGDTVCTVCNTTVLNGSTIAVTDHSYDAGVSGDDGITYTCTVCGHTETKVELAEPSVSISAQAASNKRIKLTGTFNDFTNIDDYYEITAHGLVYMQKTRLGTRVLTVNTSGRTRVNCSSYNEDGSFSYTFKPSSTSTKYTARAYLAYVDEDGVTRYVYSDPILVSYQSISTQ
ncbi:MAG: DUF4982 domain-containing protein [Lachnospiraceae bacterium]|nr:DUF4982 domain-containing protein [Lachnospiraceae bacterium]